LAWGALATAIGTLRRAADLLEGTPEREQAELLLVEALALAGRVEEAAAAGGHLITRLGTEAPELRTEVHLRLSQAAVGASRWEMARHHLGARSEEHTSELQSLTNLVCRLLLEKKNYD